MTDIPAGWYDDPEDPAQHRYWDGHQWTDHRAPKARGGSEDGAWSTIPRALRLAGNSWRELVVLALPLVFITIVSSLVTLAVIDAAIDPDLDTIMERISEPGFDPFDGGSDEAFIDSIDISITAPLVAGMIGATMLVLLGSVASLLAVAAHLAAANNGRRLSVSESYRVALPRLPRVLGIYVLWLAGAAGVALLVFLPAFISPFLLVISLPALVGLLIYAYPTLSVAYVALLVGPRDQAPLRASFALVRPQWPRVAGRVLVLNLAFIAIALATSLVSSPLSAASLTAGFLASSVIQALQTALYTAGFVVMHTDVGGPVDPAIAERGATA